ncbi:MAG TPA: SCO1664 family protein [Dehalococcoidia bacterium]|nr:SCO1664 family protein [Dehalococcoidia bacterium]
MPSQSWRHDLPDILDVLATAQPREDWLLAAGSNYVFLLRMEHPSAGEGYAVYKPQRGEAPLHDFPSGTLFKREYAAYLVSEALGWGLVPPTVIREDGLSAGIGVLQLFIVHDPARHYFNLKDERMPDMQRIALFDWLTNNADRKGGHCLLDEDGRIWCIDHGITFHAEDKLRTVIWDFQGTPVPPHLVEDVCRFAETLRWDSPLRRELAALLSERELARLEERAALIDRERVYPPPPAYRPYPWPMI